MDPDEALDGWRSVVGRARLTPMSAVTNPIWRVVGEDGREFVLKRLPEWAPGAEPVEQYRVLSYLSGVGLPVAVPVITDDGLIVHHADSLRVDPAEKRPTGASAYSLLPMLPGDHDQPATPDMARAVGAELGRMLRALADCPWAVSSYRDDPARDILDQQWDSLPSALRELVVGRRDQYRRRSSSCPLS